MSNLGYLAAGSGSIPSNIVLSAQGEADFRYDRKTKSISYGAISGAFLVLDGQHRLWGYQKCRVRHRVPVAVYQGLDPSDEARLFIDINTTQRGVPAALLLDIKHLAQIESGKEATLRQLFDRFNTDPSSPLVGKLSPSASVSGKVSRVTFNKAVGPLLSSGVVHELSAADRFKVLRNYLSAFEAELPDKSLMTRAAFFEAMAEMLDPILQITLNVSKNVKQDSIQKVIAPIARLDYKGSGGRALLDKRSIVTLMQSAIRTSRPIKADMI